MVVRLVDQAYVCVAMICSAQLKSLDRRLDQVLPRKRVVTCFHRCVCAGIYYI